MEKTENLKPQNHEDESLDFDATKKYFVKHGIDLDRPRSWKQGSPVLVIPNTRLRNILAKNSWEKFVIPSFVLLQDVADIRSIADFWYTSISLHPRTKRYSMFSIERDTMKPIVLKTEFEKGMSSVFQVDNGTYFPLSYEELEQIKKFLNSPNAFI